MKYNWDHPIRLKLERKRRAIAERMNKLERTKKSGKKYRRYKQLWKRMNGKVSRITRNLWKFEGSPLCPKENE